MDKEQLEAGLARLNEEDPPDANLPHFAGNARHGCRRARQSGPEGREISTALEVREMYVYGWREVPAEDSSSSIPIQPVLEDNGAELAIIYKEGRCKKCGFRSRSKEGRVVRVEERPPAFGRVSRA